MKKGRLITPVALLLPLLAFSQTVVSVSGSISQNTTWTADKTYLLTGFVYVKNQATLTIQPGTVIKGDKSTKGTLIVARGAKIVADGKRSQPIVFTSNEASPAPGDWGGVVICGYAPTNTTGNGFTCLGIAEGGINTPTGDALYGAGDQPNGCNSHLNDNSGILRYVRIEYAGIPFQLNNETNGLTLAGVGSGTTIDYVQVSYSGDDGFEFFGGTVNCKHLVSYCNKDDDFDCDLGYQGNIQYGLVIRKANLADISGSNGLEIDNNQAGTPATPKTRPTFSNITIVGPTGSDVDPNFRRAAHLRRNSEAGLFNSLLIGDFPVGVCIDGLASVANAENGLLEIRNTRVADSPELLKSTEQTFNISQWFSNNTWDNGTSNTSEPLALMAPFNPNDPNAQPSTSSPANNAAAFEAPRLNNGFFEVVNYIGALSSTNDWTCGWVKFETLNTNCTSSTSDAERVVTDLQLRPNATSDQTVVTFSLAESADLSVEVYNLEGQLLRQAVRVLKAPVGNQSYTLTVNDLAPGLYFVRVQAGAAARVEKLVKM